MISVEAVRAAVLDELPWAKLDELVRAEMAAGRRVKEIAAEFAAMADEVWGIPGLPEDGQDAFGDTYDALTGNCLREQCYEDPPNTTLPTEEEIAQLPRWARVALAARYARRIVPLTSLARASDLPRTVSVAYLSVTVAENAATIARPASSPSADEAAFYSHSYWENDPKDKAGSLAIGAVRCARIEAELTDELSRVRATAERVVGAGAIVADLAPAIRRDFDYLLRRAEWQHWDDDTPVPPEIFGPLWPEGAPPGWPADPNVPPRVEFVATALAKEGTPPRHVVDEALNVFNAVNRYYIARTGQRLTLEGDMPLLLAALVPEGSVT